MGSSGSTATKDAKIGLLDENQTANNLQQSPSPQTPNSTTPSQSQSQLDPPQHTPTPTRSPPKTPMGKSAKDPVRSNSDSSSSSSSSESESSYDSSSSSDDNHRRRRKRKHKKKKRRKREKRKRNRQQSDNYTIDEEDMQMLELLQEFICYYNQGDTFSDGIVRDTLEKLSPDALNHPDENGNTILMLAAQYKHLDLCETIVGKGVDVNKRNKNGECALHYSSYTDSYSEGVASLLINNGGHAEVVEKLYGCTPLHWAASSGSTSFCRLLCNAGANPNTLDSNGTDAVGYAEQCEEGVGDSDCADFLRGVKERMGHAVGLTSPGTTPLGPPKHKRFDESQWSRGEDGDGNGYYVNNATGESIWEEEYNTKRANANANTAATATATATARTARGDTRGISASS